MARILYKEIRGDGWEKVKYKKDFIRWVTKIAGFKSYEDFTNNTGVVYGDISGKWFQLIGGRIFTKSNSEMKYYERDGY